MSLTAHKLLMDAKRLTARLRDDDTSADSIIGKAQSVLKGVEAMQRYREDVEILNEAARNRPRADLVLSIQQENRHIRQLQQENKELRAVLEEHQNAIELIMSKYRQHMTCLVHSTQVDKNAINQHESKLLQERLDKICEMATVMNQSIQIDEACVFREQELFSRLKTENKGLREMLEISRRNGSYNDPLNGPRRVTRACQTDSSTTTSPAISTVDQTDHRNNVTAVVVVDCHGLTDSGSSDKNNQLVSHSSPTATADESIRQIQPSATKPPFLSTTTSFSYSVAVNGGDFSESVLPPEQLTSDLSLDDGDDNSSSTTSEDDDEDKEVFFNTIRRRTKVVIHNRNPVKPADMVSLSSVSTSSLNVENRYHGEKEQGGQNCDKKTTSEEQLLCDDVKRKIMDYNVNHNLDDDDNLLKKEEPVAASSNVNGDKFMIDTQRPKDNTNELEGSNKEVICCRSPHPSDDSGNSILKKVPVSNEVSSSNCRLGKIQQTECSPPPEGLNDVEGKC